jgi:macrolide phosphotransferase
VPTRTTAALAALASAAVRGLNPTTMRALPTHETDVDAAAVDDDLARSWVVRAPRSAAAGARLAQEARLLGALVGWLPFSVPEISGTAPLPEGGRAVARCSRSSSPRARGWRPGSAARWPRSTNSPSG